MDFYNKQQNLQLEEERPLLEFPTFLWVIISLTFLILGVVILTLPPIISILIFIGLVFMIAILLNPFVGIVVFLIGAYIKPVAYVPMLREYHPATIAALGVALIYGIHIIVYRDFKIIKSKQTTAIALFILALLASTVIHYSAPDIRFEFSRFIQVLILYFLVCYMVKTEKQVYFLSFCLVAIGGGTAAISFYNHFHGTGTLASYGIARTGLYGGNPNYLAMSLVMVLPLMLGFMVTFKNLILKIILGAIAFCCIIATIFTFSRSGALGLATVLILSAVKFTKKQGILIAAFLLILIVAVSLLFIPPQYWDRLATITRMKDVSIISRLNVYKISLLIMKDHPLFGVGLGLANFEMEYYQRAIEDPRITTLFMGWTHNMFLEVGAKVGLIALSLFIWFINLIFRDIQAAARVFYEKGKKNIFVIAQSIWIGLIAAIVMGMFADVLYEKLFWMYAGLTMVLSKITSEDKQSIVKE